ncbi:MAG: biotin-dependent carboxylase-like uncharacterized protein [Candidatus Endobugula sp.]|jgi:biotin-dependent carboxylase-like uncharacterized protein
MSLKIVHSNFLALIQDYGRYGYQSIGVTNGGPLDEHAFLWANYLLDNHYDAAQLEISYGSFSAVFTEDTMMAICGANLGCTLNQQEIFPWCSYAVKSGDVIQFSSPVSGLRCYLAVKGGFDIVKQLSSSSTVVREKLGGLSQNGAKLAKDDVLPYTSHSAETAKQVPFRFIPEYPKDIILRYMPNVSQTSAGIDAQKKFSHKQYEVTQNIDRMGYRLSGEPIVTPLAGIISQGISMGAIQVPKDGQPIVLMRDRQTMGGYPLIGCVTYLDLSKLAQSLPGTKVSFHAIDVSEAEAELILHKQFFKITS